MKEIKLTKGFVTQVDDEDYEYLNQWEWHAKLSHKTYYAVRTIYPEKKSIRMHRVLMNTPDHLQVDHIDHNGLNNQKANLRNCTHVENSSNIAGHSKYGFIGIKLNRNGRYSARICVNYKHIHIGTYNTKEEAAINRDRVAVEIRGEFANLNFK